MEFKTSYNKPLGEQYAKACAIQSTKTQISLLTIYRSCFRYCYRHSFTPEGRMTRIKIVLFLALVACATGM